MTFSRRRHIAKLAMISVVALIALGLSAPHSPSTAEPTWFRVKDVRPGSVLWVRSGPAVSFKRIGLLPYNARHIRSFGCKKVGRGTWCRVLYRHTKGWVSKNYLKRDRKRRT